MVLSQYLHFPESVKPQHLNRQTCLSVYQTSDIHVGVGCMKKIGPVVAKGTLFVQMRYKKKDETFDQ